MGEVITRKLADDLVIYQGHVLDALALMPDASVQCVCTSDPYWGLRSYGTSVWVGGDLDCDHGQGAERLQREYAAQSTLASPAPVASAVAKTARDVCRKCGARRVDTQAVDWPAVTYRPMSGLDPITVPAWHGPYGLEPTPEMYVGHSVLIRRELWRVMRDDAVQLLNLGDSYCGSGVNDGTVNPGLSKAAKRSDVDKQRPGHRIEGLKPKDLVGIPWRVAFALQADGWYLRNDIIWAKPNPMPESVTDRCTKAHEYIFLLTKSPQYYWDAVAIQEPAVGQNLHDQTGGKYAPPGQPPHTGTLPPASATFKRDGSKRAQVIPGQTVGTHRPDREDTWPTGTRNKRSVWNIATEPFPEAHFATFPEEIPRLAILAATSSQACPKCGAPWERITGRPCEKCGAFVPTQGKYCPECGHVRDWRQGREARPELVSSEDGIHRHTPRLPGGFVDKSVDTGWRPTCSCEGNDGSGKCQVLDPFAGSLTTLSVALSLGRGAIGCELNPEYIEIGLRARINKTQTTLLGQL